MTLPRKLGDFEVKRRIGSGGMAEVFLATKRGAKGTEKRLVVKRLLPEHTRSERLKQMFIHEAHLAMRLAHPNLVHVYELSDDADGGLLLSMEYVDGADLGRILSAAKRRGARVPETVAARIVELAARGLHHAHEYRDDGEAPLAIVHRDISPQNILVSRDGVVKVGDLGVASARFVRDVTGVQPGKLRYMSPEQARGERVDRRCDVYALGVVLYELLCLASPYGERRGAALARAVSHGRLERPIAQHADIPLDLVPILEGALAADPARRTATARELADALAQVLFERRAHVDEADVAAALGPYIDAETELAATTGGASGAAASGSPSARPPMDSQVSGAGSAPSVRPPMDSQVSGAGSAPSVRPPAESSAPPPPAASGDGDVTAAAAPIARRRRADDDDEEAGPAFTAGDAFDRYVLESKIGHGGMAEVFRARDTKLGREVALKLLRPDAGGASRERMIVEAQAAATFSHPGSVVVFDVGEHAGVPFIAMELVRGRTLAAHLGDASIPLARRIRWSVAVARVLAAAHHAGLVHRDVKPSNIMIKDDGEVKVLDFGIVRRHTADPGPAGAPELTAAGTILGTPGYAAPEQIRGDPVDGRADQFAWAVTTYELLAGRRPWTGESTTVLVAQMLLFPFAPLASVAPDVPAAVCAAVERALAREPEGRFPSMDDVVDMLAPHAEPDAPTPARGSALAVSSSLALTPSLALPPSISSVPPSHDPDALSLRPPSLPAVTHPSSPAVPAVPAAPAARARSAQKRAAALVLSAALGGLAAAYFTRAPEPGSALAPASAPPAAPVVASIRCEPADVTGAADAEVARALGIGACARVAVDLGVPWSDAASPHTLAVRAVLGADAARVDLALAGQTATASAREPIKAVELAAGALAAKVTPAPLTPQQIQAWGAEDDAGARRIARVFHRRELRIAPDIGAETVRLGETDPGSPFSHLLVLMNVAGSSDMLEKARERTLERIDRLPRSRQHAVRGLLLVYPVEIDRKEAARLLRESYAEAPDDHEMVSLYVTLALRMGLPEAFGVLDRLIATAPTRAIVPIENAMLRASGDDVARAERYARRWADIFPEARAAGPVIQTFLRAGRHDEARAGRELGVRLGMSAIADPVAYEGGEMDFELFTLDTARARDRARVLLGDARPYTRAQAVEGMVSAHFLDGRVDEALEALATGARLAVDTGYVQGAAHLLVRALAAGRWLRRPTVDAAQIEWLGRIARANDQLTLVQRAEALVELALAAEGPGAARERAAALETVDALAAASADDPWLHDDLLVQTVPLVRALRGDRAAAAVFHAADKARPVARARRAIDAGLLLEALGDGAAAERAYGWAADPFVARESGLERVIAAVRLGKLHPNGAALPLAARLAASADPGLLDAIAKMK